MPGSLIIRPDPCNNGNIITSSSVQNLHNGAGQRVVKTVNGDASTAIHFIYDRQGRVIAEMDAATGAALREYIYVNGQQVALVDDSGTAEEAVYYVHYDHLGTPQKITDDLQETVWAADYEPFGQAEVTTEEIAYNIRFPGQYADAESGLHYNYFRDYDPSLGRYVESDPIGLVSGLNTYAYVTNNPLFLIDFFGLQGQMSRHKGRTGPKNTGDAGFTIDLGLGRYSFSEKKGFTKQARFPGGFGVSLDICSPPPPPPQQCELGDDSFTFDNLGFEASPTVLRVVSISTDFGSTCFSFGPGVGSPLNALGPSEPVR